MPCFHLFAVFHLRLVFSFYLPPPHSPFCHPTTNVSHQRFLPPSPPPGRPNPRLRRSRKLLRREVQRLAHRLLPHRPLLAPRRRLLRKPDSDHSLRDVLRVDRDSHLCFRTDVSVEWTEGFDARLCQRHERRTAYNPPVVLDGCVQLRVNASVRRYLQRTFPLLAPLRLHSTYRVLDDASCHGKN